MLFELSSSPKPGNIDRCHDFSDIGFHHFLVSAVCAYPVFRKAAQGQARAGSLILEAVAAWSDWRLYSNTHFGSIVLMIPLAIAACRSQDLEIGLAEVLSESTVQDAVEFYRAFQLAGARVTEVKEFSLKDPMSEEELRRSGKSLVDLMRLSQGHDLVAREWSTNYERSFRLSERLTELVHLHGLNDGVVRAYLEALAEVPDSLVQAKFGPKMARQVSMRAGAVLEDAAIMQKAGQLDEDLLAEDVNPGSTADLIAASLFISLLRDLRF
jgi:triphosphoribosyl-dephospho-CoA synthase